MLFHHLRQAGTALLLTSTSVPPVRYYSTSPCSIIKSIVAPSVIWLQLTNCDENLFYYLSSRFVLSSFWLWNCIRVWSLLIHNFALMGSDYSDKTQKQIFLSCCVYTSHSRCYWYKYCATHSRPNEWWSKSRFIVLLPRLQKCKGKWSYSCNCHSTIISLPTLLFYCLLLYDQKCFSVHWLTNLHLVRLLTS